MKIRSGFVSNSSSSSFIVRFPKDPSNIDNLREMMGDCAPNCGFGANLTAEDVVNYVHRDVKTSTFESYYDDNRWDCERFSNLYDFHPTIESLYDGRCWYELTNDEQDTLIKMWLWEEYQCKFKSEPDVFICHFEYADEDGAVGSAMEHGEIFRNLEYTCKSNH